MVVPLCFLWILGPDHGVFCSLHRLLMIASVRLTACNLPCLSLTSLTHTVSVLVPAAGRTLLSACLCAASPTHGWAGPHRTWRPCCYTVTTQQVCVCVVSLADRRWLVAVAVRPAVNVPPVCPLHAHPAAKASSSSSSSGNNVLTRI